MRGCPEGLLGCPLLAVAVAAAPAEAAAVAAAPAEATAVGAMVALQWHGVQGIQAIHGVQGVARGSESGILGGVGRVSQK